MIKKAVHIILVCSFFLFGLQCSANNKTALSLHTLKIEETVSNKTFVSSSKEKGTLVTSLEKLHKKKRFSRTLYNSIASVSKYKRIDWASAHINSQKFLFQDGTLCLESFSDYGFHNSFCHRKLLSIFYTFQSFW